MVNNAHRIVALLSLSLVSVALYSVHGAPLQSPHNKSHVIPTEKQNKTLLHHLKIEAQPNAQHDVNLKSTSTRVVNGAPVTNKTEFPFVVDISTSDTDISSSRFCTGTLIHPAVVLTAAHCVLNQGYKSPIYATIGRVQLDDKHTDNDGSETFRTIASIAHSQYSGMGSPYDVALLLINGTSTARQVNLSNQTPPTGTHAWVAGYGIQKIGTLEQTGQNVEILPGRLQKAELTIDDRALCDIPQIQFETPQGLLCTTGVKIGSSACRGDSGGGLFLRHQGQFTQVGIVSYGDAQCAAEEAGVFTDVANVLQWIQQSESQLTSLLNPDQLVLHENQTELAHVSYIGAENGSKYASSFSRRSRSQRHNTLYKIQTNFTAPRKVKVSLCGSPRSENLRLSVLTESNKTIAYNRGGCPDGRLSQLTTEMGKGSLVIRVSGKQSVPFHLSLSSEAATTS